MSDRISHDSGGLDIDVARCIDAVCRRFEADRREGRQPRIDDYLVEVSDERRPALRAELEALERDLRRSEGGARPRASAVDAGRNLLCGILALQNSFINRDALLAAFNSWVEDKSRSLGQILLAQGALSAARLSLLDALVQEHLRQHGRVKARSEVWRRLQLDRVGARARPAGDRRSRSAGKPPVRRRRAPEADAEATSSYLPDAPGAGGERFRIIRFHAKGGLGEVYLARDDELHREVALKRIQGPFANDRESRSRFVLEAEVTGGLEHPGIVPVYGLGCDENGRPFYAMRFIKGDSLKEAIAQFHSADQAPGRDAGARSLALRKLLGRFVEVCNAIAYAHSRGVLHRDLKPSNVMLGPYGETLVVDWGLAKVIGRPDKAETGGLAEPTLRPPSSDGLALTQSAVGTPQFMSPEQAAADLDKIGPRSDVYSLGATLYSLLTGQTPVATDELHVMLRRVQTGEFPPPRQVKREVPAALEAICLKAMALRPESRYPTPRDLADDIEHWLADEPVSALPESPGQRSARWVRRHRTLAQSMGAASALVMLTSVLAVFFVNGARQRERTERLSAVRAQQSENEQRQLAEDNLYVNNIALANRESASGNFVRVNQLLEQCPPRLRGWEWNYLNKLCNDDLVTLQGHVGPVMGADFSPDGTRIASAGDDATVRIWDVATGHAIHVLKGHTGGLLSVKFSPDGRLIASAGRDATVRLWDALTGREAHTLTGHTIGVASIAFSPDGRLIASAGWDKTVRLWDPATGRHVRTYSDFIGAVVSVAFSPDGKRIAAASVVNVPDGLARGGEVVICEVATGKPSLALFKSNPALIECGSSVAFISGDRVLVGGLGAVFDAATGSRSPLSLDGIGHQMACSADGHYCAMAAGVLAMPGNRMTTWVSDTPGLVTISSMTNDRPQVSFLGHNDSITQITFAHDSRHVASASLDGTVKVWRISTDREGRTLTGHPAGLDKVEYSDDGQWLATGGGGQVRVWNLATGRTILALRCRGDWAFSRQGTRLALVDDDDHLTVRDAVDGHVIHVIHEKDKISGPSFSPDGRRLAAIVGKPYDGLDLKEKPASINVWDMGGGRQVQTFAFNRHDYARIHFSHDNRRLAVSTSVSVGKELPGQALIWDLSSGRQVFDRRSPPGGFFALAFSPDDKRVVTGGHDGVATIWDVETAQELLALRGHTGITYETIFGPDGRTMVTRSTDETIRLWDVRFGRQILILRGGSRTGSGFISFSPDGRRLITEGLGGMLSNRNEREKAVVLWDVASGQELVTLRGFSKGTVNAAFTPDGKRLVSAAGDGRIKLWDVRPAREQDGVASGQETVDKASQARSHGPASGRGSFTVWGHEDAVNGVVFSPDRDRLASASDDGTVKIWDAAGNEVRTLWGHWGKVFAVAFSHDGTRIASAGDDGTVRVWDAKTGEARLTIRGHTGAVSCVVFDPDDMTIASCGADKTVRVWDATNGREVHNLTGHTNPVMGLSFSADGTRIASAGEDPAVKIWDLATGREERTLKEVHGFAWRTLPAGVSYSSDGTWVASANSGDVVMIWDSGTGRLARILIGHGGRITDVEFAPGGRQLASAYEDGTLGLWEIETGKEVRTLKAHTNWVTGLSYSPDGTHIASSSLDGTIEIWEVAADPVAPRLATSDVHHGGDESWQNFVRRGTVRSEFEHWEDADREFTGAMERGADAFSRFAHALIRLQLGDIEGYRKTSQSMVNRFDNVENPAIAIVAADTWALGPQAVTDLRRPVRVCEQLVARFAKNQDYLTALGQNLYRAGRFEEAIRQLDAAARLSPDQRGSGWDWLFRAMAHHKLGHAEEAMKCLDQAVLWINHEIPESGSEPVRSGLSWNQRLALQLMRREAEALIKENRALYLPVNVFQDQPARVGTSAR